ncbi:MAG: cytochrome-c peroxidase [Pseudanabaenaceae cyanobacterium]|jgi:cytochrome c peroxidase
MFKTIVSLILIGFFWSLSITNIITEPVYAQDESASPSVNTQISTSQNSNQHYLSQQLRQFVKGAAPSGKGIEYFMLPDGKDLSQIPADPKNPLTPEKVHLGKLLFHETALSINTLSPKHWQTSSCASCHFAQAGFGANLAQGLGAGGLGFNELRYRDPTVPPTVLDKLDILVPSVLNAAYQDIQPWNGRAGVTGPNGKDQNIKGFDMNRFGFLGIEAQSIEGLNVHRMATAAIATIPEYQDLFAAAFPDRPYVKAEVEDNVRAGMAISAYIRTLIANQAPFQQWLRGDENALSPQELRGGITFFKSTCVQCHTGPSLAANNFYAMGFADHPRDLTGLNLGRGTVTQNPKDDFKFKVPQLYNLVDSAPYGHGASFNSIREVVQYLNRGVPQKQEVAYAGNLSGLFKPLNLDETQIDDLTAFIETGLRDPDLMRYVPEKLPSGLCFPHNDPESRQQLHCDSQASAPGQDSTSS